MNDHISLGGTDLTKKPKYAENFWKNLIFIYACLILSLTLSLSVNSISYYETSNTGTQQSGHRNSTNIVLDVFLTILYTVGSSILIAIFAYLHINHNQTFEEAKKENSKSSEIHYSMCGEKVGLYLRFGVVLIGSLSLIHIVLSNASSKTYLSECSGLSLLFSSIFQSLFFIIQTVFILKYHSVVILKNTRLIQFGLYSIVFINITIWEISSLTKIKYSSANTVNFANTTNCTDKNSETLYLYFLPAVSEYCVICMAIVYEIMKRLGRISLIETSHTEHQKNFFWKIRKSVSGVIIGILIAFICIGFTIFVIIMDDQKATYVFIVHNVEEIVLYIFSIVILILAFLKTNQLKFSFTYLSNNVDKNLLFVSCFLSIAFSVLLGTFCFQRSNQTTIMLIRAITAVLEIIQIIIQTYVIQDAFYRCSDNVEQQETKPGQGYLAILVGCNFGLWLFKSFQLKNGDIFFHKTNQDDRAKEQTILSFFVYLTLPLSILYRFHSSSCLADVFSKIYEGEDCRFEGLLRAEGFEKCGMGTVSEEPKNNIPQILIQDGSQKVGRPRAITLPEILHVVQQETKSLTSKKMARRETIKNLETAKLRVLSSHFSHNMVTKKLSATVAPSMNSSTLTLDESDNEKSSKQSSRLSPKLTPKFSASKKDLNSPDSDMSTVKHLVVGNLFNSSLKRRKSNDDRNSIILKTVKFRTNTVTEQNGEEMNL